MAKKYARKWNRFLFFIKEAKNRRTILFWLAGALFAAAIVTFGIIYSEGRAAEDKASELLQEYEAAIAVMTPEPAEQEMTEKAEPAPTTAADVIIDSFEGHQIIGKLTAEKIEMELPIIAYMDDEALEVSVCYYQGAMPGETGNLVITGHNFANGAHFGRLDELDKGDMVELSTPTGDVYMYRVYDKDMVTPDSEEALDDTKSDTELTLLTCASHGNSRLIVRCELAWYK